jgi:transcriptional regulator with XRE-family HTH domain
MSVQRPVAFPRRPVRRPPDRVMTETLAARMKELRDARRWSLREAAEKTGVSKSMLSKIERGTASPTATVLGRLAEGFGMSISQFVGGEVRRDDVVLLPREDQPIFRVPTTGFERRSLSPVSHNGRAVDFCVTHCGASPPGQSPIVASSLAPCGAPRMSSKSWDNDVAYRPRQLSIPEPYLGTRSTSRLNLFNFDQTHRAHGRSMSMSWFKSGRRMGITQRCFERMGYLWFLSALRG